MKLARRAFLKLGVAAGTGLVFKFVPRRAWAQAPGRASSPLQPNGWVCIDSDGHVRVTVARSEMGQGVRTSLPLMIAEELDVDPATIEVVQARPGPTFPNMRTGGSFSVGGGFDELRRAGAAAREMLVSAAAATWNVPRERCVARDGSIVESPGGRTLAYGALVEAASRLEVPSAPPLRPIAQRRRIGQRTKRYDAPAIVDGSARYGLDVRVPGMRFAAIARPPAFGGRVAKWDAKRAKAVAGVVDVVAVPSGVAVVATSTWAAMCGRDMLDVEYDDGPNAAFDSTAFRKKLAEAAQKSVRPVRIEGDLDAALRSATTKLEALYEYPFLVHAPLEPMNAIADVRDGSCTVWTGTQAANQAQTALAQRLGIGEDKVTIELPLLGGGFGRRLAFDYALEAADVSKAVKAPVQVVWTREDDMRHGYFQPASAHWMTGANGDDGLPSVWLHREAGSPLNSLRRPNVDDPDFAAGQMWGGFDNPYAYPAMRVEYALVDSPVPSGPWRAVHAPSNVLARECFLDELALAAKRDPLEVRRAILARPGGASDGTTPELRARLRRVLEVVAEKSDWGKPQPAGRGRGIAGHVYDSETTIAMVAEVSVGEKGRLRIHRIVTAIDCGLVVNPLGVEGQVESAVTWGISGCLDAEVVIRRGRVETSSYTDYPVVRFPDAPPIDVHLVPSGERPFGVGEQPVPTVAPAILNAIFAATGRRIRRLPLRPGDLVG
ncbi:MAG: xanthine dehydrogenase family protein molybdopterin-binding subunit [Planctomycetes bacterium]|nr:xanthine dehydrogenase family protein molybdopterin-binding subunit [Planctomycetota bacterium]